MISEFRAFLTKSNAIALAIGVIIGGAMGKVVTALTNDVLMPIIGLILPKGDWREAQYELSKSITAGDPLKNIPAKVTINAIKYGDMIGSIVDFVIIALVVFMITKALIKPDPEVPTQTCPFCKETNAVDATKCKACTSALS